MKNLKKIYKIVSRNVFSRNILLDDDMWEYTLKIFDKDYNSVNDFKNFLTDFKEQYGEDTSLFFKEYYNFIEKMCDVINKIILNDDIVDELNEEVKKFSQTGTYLEDGRKYFSIDINCAFDQLIDRHGNLEEPIQTIREQICNKTLINNRKNVRIVSGWTTNTKYLYTFINVMTWRIYNSGHFLLKKMQEIGAPLVNVVLDELIFDITDINEDLSNFIGEYEISGYKVHTSIFRQHHIFYKDYAGEAHCFFIKEMNNGKINYVSRNCPYFLQIYKKFNNEKIIDMDLRVKSIDVAKPYFQFNKPITFITEEEFMDIKN
jgi:hypothetical protein